jgi:multidrug resistance protein, MATE family
MVIQFTTCLLHILWSYVFVTVLEMRLNGTAIANAVTATLNLFAITFYTSYYLPELKEAWFWPTKESFRNIREYLNVAVPSMLMLCLEWWSFEIQTVLAS